MPLSEEQLKLLRARLREAPPSPGKGTIDLEARRKALISPTPTPTPAPETKERPKIGGLIKEDVGKRLGKIRETFEEAARGDISPAETGIRVPGQVIAGVGDLVFRGLQAAGRGVSAVTPDFIEDPVKDKLKSLGKDFLASPTGQKALFAINQGMTTWDAFRKENPRAAKNVEAVVNISELFPLFAGTKVTRRGAGAFGRTLEKSGEAGIKKQRQTAVRKLLEPERTKKVKEAQVSRTTEKGSGIFKRSVIEPEKDILKAEEELFKIPGIKKDNTVQQNFNVVKESNKQEAIKLKSSIEKNDFLVPKKETVSRLKKAKETLSESPTLVGDAQKTADKLLNKMIALVDENKGSGSGVLKARKQYDAWVKTQKPKAFDANKEGAFEIANKEIRKTLNDMLDEKAIDIDVKDSLARQRTLFTAQEALIPKAAKEADTAIGRAFQRAKKVVGTRNESFNTAAAALGLGGIAAGSIAFAAPAAAIGIPAFFLFKAGKLILNPKVRKTVGKMLASLDDEIGRAGAKEAVVLKESRSEIQKFLDANKE